MNLLITGGTGFFGRALLKTLLGQPPDGTVTVLTRNPQAFLHRYPQFKSCAWLQWFAGDVTEAESLRGLDGHQRFSHVLHAATDSSLPAGAALPNGQQQLNQMPRRWQMEIIRFREMHQPSKGFGRISVVLPGDRTHLFEPPGELVWALI
jgi:UDP-glucose 4-epimerase